MGRQTSIQTHILHNTEYDLWQHILDSNKWWVGWHTRSTKIPAAISHMLLEDAATSEYEFLSDVLEFVDEQA